MLRFHMRLTFFFPGMSHKTRSCRNKFVDDCFPLVRKAFSMFTFSWYQGQNVVIHPDSILLVVNTFVRDKSAFPTLH